MQATAKARRSFQYPGRGIASYGRKEKGLRWSLMMLFVFVFDDDKDEEMTWHSLLTRVTHSQTKKTHNLGDAIDNNYSAAHKHDKTMF